VAHRYLGAGQDIGGTLITNSGSPSSATDLANKGYVDNLVAGLEWKQDVRAATTANGTLATAYANGGTLDTSYTLVTGDRILIKNQTTQTENGIYTVNASGAPTRATDCDTSAELNNATVSVTKGTVNAGLSFTQTTADPAIGSSNIVWGQFNAGTVYTASSGVTLTAQNFTLSSTAAGAGLTYTTGVLAVVATDTSLTVAADSVGVNLAASSGLAISSGLKIDTTLTARLFRSVNPTTAGTTVTVTHNLGVQAVACFVSVTATGEVIDCDMVNTSTSVTTLTFGSAPTTATLTILILG